MSDEPAGPSSHPQAVAGESRPARALTPAAVRALAEAEARRRATGEDAARPREVNGRAGPEPTRFGDWEKNGIISDF